MGAASIPISIVYDTQGETPLRDVIASLQAAEHLVTDAVSILPSLIPGLSIELRGVNVRRISQESPLTNALAIAVWVTSQKAIEDVVVGTVEALFGVPVDPKYETILTLVVLVLLLEGVSLAKNVVLKKSSDGPAQRKLDALIDDLAVSTGRPKSDLRQIIDAKYSKPGPVKSLVKAAVSFFLPSTREGNRAVDVAGERIEPDIVGDVPLAPQVESDQDFQKFVPMSDVELQIHAQDIDKANTGWAAVPLGVTDRRLKLRLVEPVLPEQVWGKSRVTGDIVLISDLTADGYRPREIQLTNVIAAE